MVIRRVSTGPPVEVAYELSAKGRDLEQVIDGVERWAHEWLGRVIPAPHVRACAPMTGRV